MMYSDLPFPVFPFRLSILGNLFPTLLFPSKVTFVSQARTVIRDRKKWSSSCKNISEIRILENEHGTCNINHKETNFKDQNVAE